MLKANTYFVSSHLSKAVLINKHSGPKFFVAENKTSALKISQSLEALGENVVLFCTEPQILFQENSNEHDLIKKTNKIYFEQNICAVFSANALSTRFISREYARQNFFEIEKNKQAEIGELTRRLVCAGFEKAVTACEPNTFCQKGDVLDINIKETNNLCRIYFFGKTVENIFKLDGDFKRVCEIEKISFSALKNCFNLKKAEKQNHILNSLSPNAKQKLETYFEKAGSINPFLFAFDVNTFLSVAHVFKNSAVFIENPSGIKRFLSSQNKENLNEFKSLLELGEVTMAHKPLFINSADEIFENCVQCTSFQNILASNPYFSGGEFHNKSERVLNAFGSVSALCSEIKKLVNLKRITVFIKNNFFKNSFAEFENIIIKTGDFGGSVVLDDEAYLTLKQEPSPTRVPRSPEEKFAPKQGDFVVHSFHGIGLCKGLTKRTVAGEEKDFFAIEYAGGSLLLVPCENADEISRFSGGGEHPKLNILGGKDFENVKSKVRASLKKIAFNLAALFKERISHKGFKFNDDCELQKEFEARFAHEETAGQLSAIADIKADMCSTKIMDRLICADVGFGKTEVALRAAFKAVLSGKQVLFLSPTTILCFQHFKNAQKRFEDFGVNVALLNRFVSNKKQKEIIANLKTGKINIVFGTHKLLNENIEYFDLGLLIIDEEQRFGTAQKEKLKNLKKTLDVLTLSATPIPRTLHLSLIKVRDISIIDTPPKNRISPIVYVCDFSLELIKTALMHELSRGGQAFVVFNNIEKINAFAASLKKILPAETKIDVAHARLTPNILESKVEKLFSGETQIFVSTTIIENGLDIKNANTIIVVNAQDFGLADLYQLKGRVGRTSETQAYAYFMHKNGMLGENANKRLSALSDFSALGGGFEIAMKDLEIRGSGNVFGAEQSGHLNKVGYTEFVKIVDEVVAEALGKKTAAKKNDVLLEIKLPSFVPESFESDTGKRIEIYKFLQFIESEETLKQSLEKLKNEYNSLPVEIENLANIILLKNKAQKFNITKILINENIAEIVYSKENFEITKELSEKTEKFGAVLKLYKLPIISLKPKNSCLNTVKHLTCFLN